MAQDGPLEIPNSIRTEISLWWSDKLVTNVAWTLLSDFSIINTGWVMRLEVGLKNRDKSRVCINFYRKGDFLADVLKSPNIR